jgi:hypothetical protein
VKVLLEGASRFCGMVIAMGEDMLGSELNISNCNILPPKRGEYLEATVAYIRKTFLGEGEGALKKMVASRFF